MFLSKIKRTSNSLNFRQITTLSETTCTSTETHAKESDPKPFEAIPKQSWICRETLPGGILNGKSMDEWYPYFQKKHGDIIRFPGFLGRPPMVITFDPADIKKVYSHAGSAPYRLGLETWTYWRENKELFKSFKGLVISQGETWQKYRTIINPIMMQPKTISLYVPEIDEVAKDFVSITKNSLDQNNETPADYSVYIQRFVMESMGTIAFERRLNLLEPNEGNKGTVLAKLVNDLFHLTFELDGKPSIWKLYKTKKFYQLMETMDKSAEIIKEYVDEAVVRFEKEGSQKPEALQGILYKLLKVDKETAIIVGMDMLSVGIDTTTSSIKSLIYYLATNIDKQNKLREEILTLLPSKDDKLTAEKMKHIPYLRACLKETLRLMPVLIGTARRLPTDLILQGYKIPKGIDVFLPHGVISKQEDNFGRGSEFIPERWLKDESHAEAAGCPHAKNSHPFTYMPFGFGGRACIGKRIAEIETMISVVRLVRNFKLSWHYEVPKTKFHTTKEITGDFKVRLQQI